MNISVNTAATHGNCSPKPRSLWARVRTALVVNRQRRQLLNLDNHTLADIGLTRSEANAEGRQSMWNVPNHWRK